MNSLNYEIVLTCVLKVASSSYSYVASATATIANK